VSVIEGEINTLDILLHEINSLDILLHEIKAIDGLQKSLPQHICNHSLATVTRHGRSVKLMISPQAK